VTAASMVQDVGSGLVGCLQRFGLRLAGAETTFLKLVRRSLISASVSESISRSRFRISGQPGKSRNAALYGKRQDD
jgi:hypothetical protein